MKIDDKLLKDSIIESKIHTDNYVMVSKNYKDKILSKYVDNEVFNNNIMKCTYTTPKKPFKPL